MPVSAAAVAYSVAGGLIVLSGIKGSTLSDTVRSVLTGNLSGLQDTETITVTNGSPASGASPATGPGTSPGTPAGGGGSLNGISGTQILADAMKYNGHVYVYGGPSNPNGGWDCSSFASYVLGHDLGLMLPGNVTWSQATADGTQHGPTADQFSGTPGFSKVGTDPAQNQPGDLLVWTGHVGFGTGAGGMFSAYDTQSGTLATTANAPYAYEGTYRAG